MAEPTVAEVQRLILRVMSAGTVKRLDILHGALLSAYRVGRTDELRCQDENRELVAA